MDLKNQQERAQQGNRRAQFKLGEWYYYREGNYGEAVRYLSMASANGHAHASFLLGCIHDNIYDEHYDPKEAVKWYKKAAEQSGNKMALYEIGEAYLYGVGVKCDKQEAIKYLKLAAENGSKDATELINYEKDHPIISKFITSLASPSRKIINYYNKKKHERK